MKQLRLVALALASTALAGLLRAADEERRAPPIEIPDFSNLDEYIYEPRSTLTFGFRYLGGAKTSFSGRGSLPSPENPGAAKGANLQRIYHDGAVQPDARTASRLDTSGNPIIDPSTNNAIVDPIAPDGRTNSWNYTDASQLTNYPGYVAFHSYSAVIDDSAIRQKKSESSSGMDIAASRDMGKLFGRLPWTLTAGVSINDLSANTTDKVRANLTTITDVYSLFGQTPPDAPYTSPSSSTTTVVDASGNPLLNDDGTSRTVTTDTSVLIGNEPAARFTGTALDNSSVTNHWKLRGAYYTFRAGPTVMLPVSSRLKATVSLGAAMVYSGSTYTVTQTFTPSAGADISDTSTSNAYKILPGYYADATVQFDLTERTGFYAGAVLQSAGSYTQAVDTTNAHYTTKIDLANQHGIRAGMSYRF